MCLLVGRVKAQQLLPAACAPEQLRDPKPKTLPRFLQPRLTKVFRKQLTGKLQGTGAFLGRHRIRGQRRIGGRLECEGVDLERRVRE